MENVRVTNIAFIDLNVVYGLKEVLGDPDVQGSPYDRLESQGLVVIVVKSIVVSVLGNYYRVTIDDGQTIKYFLGNTKIHAEAFPGETGA